MGARMRVLTRFGPAFWLPGQQKTARTPSENVMRFGGEIRKKLNGRAGKPGKNDENFRIFA